MERDRKITVVLLGLFLLGLLLRLWGAGHGLNDKLFTHPDEIPFAYKVEGFSKGHFSYPLWANQPLWTYLNTLGVYLYSFLEGILKYPLGLRHSFFEVPDAFGIILIGRVIAGVLGGMTIPIVYLIGKRFFNEKTGLLCAGILAVLYLHVAQSHYAYVDVPQTFFFTLSFYFMVKVSLGEGKWNSFLAGVFLALSMATKINTAPGLITLIFAHYLKMKSTNRMGIQGLIKSKDLYISLLGLILGYGLCIPYYWLRPMTPVWSAIGLFKELFITMKPSFNIFERIKNLTNIVLNMLGLPFILIFSLISIIIIRRDWKVFLILSFPLAYLPFFVLAPWHDQRELIPVIPFIVIFIAYGIYRMTEVIPFRRKGAIMLIVSLFLILPSLWLSLKTDYFLWQKDTRVLAAEWIRENLPRNARIGMEGHIYYNIPIYYERYEINGEFSKIPFEEVKKHIDFIVVSSIIYNNLGPEKKKYYDSLKEKSQLIKVFSTVPSYFFNPRIEVYKLSHHGEAITSVIPKTYSEKDSYYMSFGEGSYGKEPLSFWIWPGTKIKRVLIAEKKLKTIGIFIYNGSEKTDLKVKTTFNRKKMTLNPYERKAILINPSRSFPFIEYIYNISIGCGGKGGAFVSIETAPKKIANALLELNDWERAIQVLSEKVSIDQEEWSLLGLAYSMGERYKDALDTFKKGLTPSMKELLDGNEWKKFFEKFTNIDSAFLVDSLTVNYNIDQFHQQVGRKMVWMAHFDPRFDRPGFLLFGSYKKFPIGHFKVIFRIKVIGSGEGPAARIDVINGDTILAERIIKDTKGRVEEFSLDFYNDEPDRRIEFRVEALGGKELWVEEVKVFPDIQGHYKKFMGIVHHRWGLSAGDLGLREEAIEHFKIADRLGYNETEGFYKMAGVYEKMGMKEEAIRMYGKVLNETPNHMDSLLALRRLSPERWIEQRIKYLTSQHEVRQNFGDLIEFIGYSIDGDKIQPGGEFEISYFWSSLKKLRSNYSIFVHFRRNGNTIFQNDHSPSMKTNRWGKGDIVKENHRVGVPSDAPEGRYNIIIGLWDSEGTKERLKLKGQTTDELKIGSIEVLKGQ